jgi:hypothetical protein
MFTAAGHCRFFFCRGTGRRALLSAKLSPLECALPNRNECCTILVQITPLESALTRTPFRKSFGMRTYKKQGGGGLTHNYIERALNVSPNNPSER